MCPVFVLESPDMAHWDLIVCRIKMSQGLTERLKHYTIARAFSPSCVICQAETAVISAQQMTQLLRQREHAQKLVNCLDTQCL